MPLADCDGFFCRAGTSAIEPGKSPGYVQEVVAQNCPEWQQHSPPRPLCLHRQLEYRQSQAKKSRPVESGGLDRLHRLRPPPDGRVLVQIAIGLGMMEGMQGFVRVEELFKGRHFDQEIVVLNVRWYLTYKLSYRDLVAMMAERGIDLAHTTILRWVQHYTPEFEKRWNRFARSVGGSWRMDETYVRVKGRWT